MATSTILTQLGAINLSLQGIAAALQVQPFWDTQIFAAIVGGMIGLAPSLYLFYKDRAIIKVELGHSLIPFSHEHMVRSGLWVKISNIGRRSITVESFFLEFENGETMVFTRDDFFVGGSGLPKVLNEGTSHTVNVLAGTIATNLLKRGNYPIAACYRDAVGKLYKAQITKQFWETFFNAAAKDSNASVY